jgi:integrase
MTSSLAIRRVVRIDGKVIGWHGFRHSLATNLRAAGVDLKTGQELLRHANSRITLEVYTRAISSTNREANDRVMQMFLAAGKKTISAPSPRPSRTSRKLLEADNVGRENTDQRSLEGTI